MITRLLLAMIWLYACALPGPFAPPVIRNSDTPVDQILIISIDAMRPDHLSCYGYSRQTTPAIDSVARDGVRFTRSYSQANWTKPSIASLFTGLYQRHHGVTVGSTLIEPDGSVRKGDVTYPLPDSLPVVAASFRASNFRTAGFVENSHITPEQGFARGFEIYERKKPATTAIKTWLESLPPKDRVFGFIHLIGPHDPYTRGDDPKYREYRNRFPLFESNVDFMNLDYKKRKDLTHDDVQEVTALYDAELSFFDGEYVRPLIDWLRETGRYDQLLIVVTSDHGEELYDHQGWAHGHSLYEEVTRVPLIIKPPRALQINDSSTELTVDEIVELIDLYPTLADLAGIVPPDTIDGRSIAPLLRGRRAIDHSAFAISEYGRSFATHLVAAAIVQGTYKMIERYDVPFGPEVSGFGIQPETQALELVGTVERPLEGVAAERAITRLSDLLHGAVGIDNAVTLHDNSRIVISEDEIEQLRALGYLED